MSQVNLYVTCGAITNVGAGPGRTVAITHPAVSARQVRGIIGCSQAGTQLPPSGGITLRRGGTNMAAENQAGTGGEIVRHQAPRIGNIAGVPAN